MRAERWEETQRREVGISTGFNNHTGGNFVLLYMVTECRKVRGRVVEWRERLAHGRTLYQCAQTVACNAAMLEVVAKGARALTHLARAQDERAFAESRATSRRKRR